MVTSKKHLETLEADNEQMKNKVAHLREQLSKYVDSDSELENRAMKQQVESLKTQLEQQAADAVSGAVGVTARLCSSTSVDLLCWAVVIWWWVAIVLDACCSWGYCAIAPLLRNRTAGT